MSGSIELDPAGEHLLIRFPYREDLVEEVRTLPGRRWDRGAKLWRVPAKQVELVYKTFTKHFFHFAPEVSGLLAGTVAPAKQEQRQLRLLDDSDDEPAGQPESLTVSTLNEQVRDALRDRFAQPVWLVGEVVGFDKARKGGHLFFTLAEKRQGETRAQATVDTVLYAQTADWLLPELEKGDQPLTLQDGIEIRALVRVDVYVPGGRYQVVIDRIDPTFTLGKMALDRERILQELRKAGLERRNLEQALPQPTLRLGVLTSPDADGWNDFQRQLAESGIGFDLTLFPVRVQGPQLRPGMLAGLAWFAERAEDFDALCIVRGGGSRTDLAWFDDLEVALAVASHPLKVLCGIGHQRDQSVLDLIAHSEKTPTALGAFLVERVCDAREALRHGVTRLDRAVHDALAERHGELARGARDLERSTRSLLRTERADVARSGEALRASSRRRLAEARRVFRQAGRDLQSGTALRLQRAGERLRRGTLRLGSLAQSRLERARSRLEGHEARRRLLDPKSVLARGYALVRGEDERVIPDATGVRKGERLRIRMRDGTVAGRAEHIELD